MQSNFMKTTFKAKIEFSVTKIFNCNWQVEKARVQMTIPLPYNSE